MRNWCALLLIQGDCGRIPMGHRLCFRLSSESYCQTTHLLILKTTSWQAASGSFIITTSLDRLAVVLLICLLKPLIEMRSLYKGFDTTAVNAASAGRKYLFPCRQKDVFRTSSLQQLSSQYLSKPWYSATGEAFREKIWDSMDGMRDVSHSLLPGKRNQKGKKEKAGGNEERKIYNEREQDRQCERRGVVREEQSCNGTGWQSQPVITHQGTLV